VKDLSKRDPEGGGRARVLIVDDEPEMRLALRESIVRMGYDTESAADPVSALEADGFDRFALVITDMKMPRMDGLAFLGEIRKRAPRLPVVVITGHGTVENAVSAMKQGAVDYLMKPFSHRALRNVIEKLVRREEGVRMIAESAAMRSVLERAERAARSDVTVLITGESGTGKEVLARYIHAAGPRRSGPFVAVNCAAIPDNLLESELFGHEKGAFTGALERRIGRFEMASGGCILLDEISEMPLSLQAKLLRVIQEREIDRVGGTAPIPVDIQVLATTNRELEKEVAAGRFREDLFYRLNVLPVELPPLRRRPEDLRALTRFFMEKYGGGRELALSPPALERILSHRWKGNIRELENVVQRACLLSDGEIRPEHLQIEKQPAAAAAAGSLKEMERELILKTLEETGGNRTEAARRLGFTTRTLRNKLRLYRQSFPGGESFSAPRGGGGPAGGDAGMVRNLRSGG